MSEQIFPDQIIREWSTVLYGAGHEREAFFAVLLRELEAAAFPDVAWEYEELGVEGKSFGKGAKGDLRPYLAVFFRERSHIRTYVGAWGYGSTLVVSEWIYSADPKRGARLGDLLRLNVFTKEQYAAYNRVVHHAVARACQQVAEGLGQDPALVDVEAKDFLAVW